MGSNTTLNSTLCAKMQGKNVIVFSEMHNLGLTLPWFIKNMLADLPALGVQPAPQPGPKYYLVTEAIHREVSENWKSVCSLLGEFTSSKDFKARTPKKEMEDYKWFASEEAKADIGEIRAWGEYYWLKKTEWLKHQLESGKLSYLKTNLDKISEETKKFTGKERDELLLLVVVAVDLGIKILGLTTPEMMGTDPTLPYLESIKQLTEWMKEDIEYIIAQGQRAICYSGGLHGDVVPPEVVLDVEGIGYKDVPIGRKIYEIRHIGFAGSNFSVAHLFEDKGYLHVELFVGHEKDIDAVKDRIKTEDENLFKRVNHIKDMLKKKTPQIEIPKINGTEIKNTVTIFVPAKRQGVFDINSYIGSVLR